MSPAGLVSILGLECFRDLCVHRVIEIASLLDESELLSNLEDMCVHRDDRGTVHAEQGDAVRHLGADAVQLDQLLSDNGWWLASE